MTGSLRVIGHIKTDFPTKFGIPRQSGVVAATKGTVIFEPEFRSAEALRGLEGYSHIWLLWEFSEARRDKWSPTVRPPRLGGNKRMGVFATRSPFRPNPIGLSSVRLERIYKDKENGLVIEVSGADLLDGTPIYDIKPYIPYTDSHPDASGGFSDGVYNNDLRVEIPESIEKELPVDVLVSLKGILAHDPRPGYQEDESRVYSFEYACYHIEFSVCGDLLTVKEIKKLK